MKKSNIALIVLASMGVAVIGASIVGANQSPKVAEASNSSKKDKKENEIIHGVNLTKYVDKLKNEDGPQEPFDIESAAMSDLILKDGYSILPNGRVALDSDKSYSSERPFSEYIKPEFLTTYEIKKPKDIEGAASDLKLETKQVEEIKDEFVYSHTFEIVDGEKVKPASLSEYYSSLTSYPSAIGEYREFITVPAEVITVEVIDKQKVEDIMGSKSLRKLKKEKSKDFLFRSIEWTYDGKHTSQELARFFDYNSPKDLPVISTEEREVSFLVNSSKFGTESELIDRESHLELKDGILTDGQYLFFAYEKAL